MSLTLELWSFTKRRNSTKIPTSTGTIKNVVLKEKTSINNPTFILNTPNISWNYAKFEGNYYFVNDIRLQYNDVYEIDCTIDALATYRNIITGSTCFVERSASSYDIMVNDNLLSEKQEVVYKANAQSNFTLFDSQGTYIVLVSGKHGLIPYAFPTLEAAGNFYSATQFSADDALGGIDTIVKSIDDLITSAELKTANLTDYCSNILWVPISYQIYAAAAPNVSIGYWDLNLSGFSRLVQADIFQIIDITLPANYYNDFRKTNPNFSKYSLYLPGIGEVGLNAMDCGSSSLKCAVYLDALSGAVQYIIMHSDGTHIATYNGQVGVEFSVAVSGVDPITITMSAIGAVASASHGDLMGAVYAGMNIVNNVRETQGSTHGGRGNMTSLINNLAIIASVECYASKEFALAECGRPLYQNVLLSTLSGYCKCANASIPINADAYIIDLVNTTLNSGFYIE